LAIEANPATAKSPLDLTIVSAMVNASGTTNLRDEPNHRARQSVPPHPRPLILGEAAALSGPSGTISLFLRRAPVSTCTPSGHA
jgi:hypothetical protein